MLAEDTRLQSEAKNHSTPAEWASGSMVPLVQFPQGNVESGLGGYCTCNGFESQLEYPQLREPKSHIKQIYLTCVPKDIIFIILDKKQICLLLHRYWMLYLPRLFPKKKNPCKDGPEQRSQCLCSKDVQKYKGDMENCLPAITHLLWMNVPIIVAFYSSVSVAQAASFNSVSFTFYSMW